MSLAPDRLAIGIRRHYTTPGVHPYDQVVWEKRDARISNWKDGSVAFEQLGVEFPEGWSATASNIVAQKYFRGLLGAPEREDSLQQVIDRVAAALADRGRPSNAESSPNSSPGLEPPVSFSRASQAALALWHSSSWLLTTSLNLASV